MNDFLTNLVARSFGTLQAIRPRLPSPYEPYRRRSGLLGMSSGAEWSPADDLDQAPEQAVKGNRPMQEKGARPYVPTLAPAPAEKEARGSSMLSPSALLPRQGRLPWSRQSAPSSEPAMAVRESSSAEPAAAPKVVTTGRTENRAATEEGARGGQPAAHAEVLLEARGDGPLQTNPGIQPQPRPDARDGNGMVPRRRVASQSLAPPRVVVRTPSDLLQSRSEESTIHVTIGKVEVRAILPDPPSRRPPLARSRPTLSLNDYLKQRDRGQR